MVCRLFCPLITFSFFFWLFLSDLVLNFSLLFSRTKLFLNLFVCATVTLLYLPLLLIISFIFHLVRNSYSSIFFVLFLDLAILIGNWKMFNFVSKFRNKKMLSLEIGTTLHRNLQLSMEISGIFNWSSTSLYQNTYVLQTNFGNSTTLHQNLQFSIENSAIVSFWYKILSFEGLFSKFNFKILDLVRKVKNSINGASNFRKISRFVPKYWIVII
jgi:hypothetical protein